MPQTKFASPEKYAYLNGFGNHQESEALPNTIPPAANSPQKVAHGLYAEKLSGTAFTAPRSENLQSWLYRILPSAAHERFRPYRSLSAADGVGSSGTDLKYVPDQLRWSPFDHDIASDWTGGLRRLGGAGSAVDKSGLAVYVYAVGKDMEERTAFSSADGDFLIVPQDKPLDIQTELGRLFVRPQEIAVIPRGIRYRVTLPDGASRGYIAELHEGHFALPELGPIGSNGLANARDFQAPTAHFDEDTGTTWQSVVKFNHDYFVSTQQHTPFDVVGWHGNYYPFKYDLGRFNTIGSISYDHPDPSIFTVLTAPSPRAGTAIIDFVIFPPRWLVAEGTFRPPWYHRNVMSEFMGLIAGDYDAKEGGFAPGGASLHNVMSGHGPDAATFHKASNADLAPAKVGEGSMAFMFESCMALGLTEWGLRTCQKVQDSYNADSWVPLKIHFKRPAEDAT